MDENNFMGKILVVIDMQTRFIKDCAADSIVPAVVDKIISREKEGFGVLLTCDKSGGMLNSAIAHVCKGKKIYKKHSYGCPELILDLNAQNPETVEFAGICTDICVITNVLATMAFLPFSEIVLDKKCCASPSYDGHLAALRVMEACKIKII